MRKKPVTLSDKINKLFDPDAGPEYSDESGSDEAAPKFSEFDELPETTGGTGLSEIRKRNVQLLEDIDQKYGGAVSSRKEAFGEDEDENYFREEEEDDDEDDDDDDGEEDDEEDDFGEEEDDDEDEEEQHKAKKGSILRLKPPQSDDDYDSGEGDSDADDSGAGDSESDEQDEDSFATYLQQTQAEPAPKTKLITEENRQETIGKGLAVQNQLKLWERMLEMRIKLQPCVIAANSLPSVGSYDRFSRESEEFREKASETTKTITDTLDSLLKLQEKLFDQFSETKQLLKAGSKRKAVHSRLHSGSGKRSAVEEYEACLASRAHDTVDYRNGVLMKWHDRTKIASSVRNQKQSLSVLKKIEDSLINREELVRKTQLYRGGYQRLGRLTTDSDPSKPSGQSGEKQGADDREVQEDQPAEAKPEYDEEIYEDSDFYHQLLRELIEYKTNTTDSPQEIANKLAELQKLRNKMKKNVDTRATKGRKIRYVVHKKLVNFMAPIPDYDWTDEAKDELFGSLFGKIPTTATE